MDNYNIELIDSSDFHQSKQSQIIFYFKKFLNKLDILFTIKLIIWILLLRQSLRWEFLQTYIIFSFIFLIFQNLGKRKQGEMSAYSVFNKNFAKLLGESEGGIESAMGLKSKNQENQDQIDQQEIEDLQFKEQWDQIPYSKKANLPCICKSGKKFKKCCYWDELKEKQLENQYKKDQIRQNLN